MGKGNSGLQRNLSAHGVARGTGVPTSSERSRTRGQRTFGAAAELVAQELRRLSKDRITVVIAHEFEHLESFDQIVFIQSGRLVAKAPHEELLRKNASYRSVLRAGKEATA